MEKRGDKDKRKKTFHEKLKGFDIKVNTFGELESEFPVDKINAFLNETVDDKKLRGHKPVTSSESDEEE